MRARSGTPWWRRRSFLVVISLLAVLALIAVACDSDSGDGGATASGDINEQREAVGLSPLTDEQPTPRR